jgi:hypothetical protein
MRLSPQSILSLAAVLALIPLGALAQAPHEPVAQMVTTAATVEWQPAGDHAPIVLSLQRPDGQVVTETFAAGSKPMLHVENLGDGLYSYELRNDLRVQSGAFTIRNGAVVPANLRENSVRFPLKPSAETYFADFVSAAGGLCGGSDCTSTETFTGFATIKAKANNVRLKFEDTSTAAGFPSTDWQISANDTFSGGANKLFVEDLTAGTVPFLIEGGTPTNTLYVDSAGRVGVGTSLPAHTLHLSDAVYPAIRMENTTSPLQNWDVVGSNNNWLVRDVNHETDPFIIRPAAPYYSLVVDSTGRIGLGVSSPLYQIHHSSGARLDAGVWVDASSRKVKQDIHQLDTDAAFEALRGLEPVTFAYKSNPTDMHVGFIAEDVPDLVATPDRTGLAPMDIVAVLTKIVQEQQKTITEMRARLDRLEKQ